MGNCSCTWLHDFAPSHLRNVGVLTLEPDFSKLKHLNIVIARLVRATYFVSYRKLGRPHEAGDDECESRFQLKQ